MTFLSCFREVSVESDGPGNDCPDRVFHVFSVLCRCLANNHVLKNLTPCEHVTLGVVNRNIVSLVSPVYSPRFDKVLLNKTHSFACCL